MNTHINVTVDFSAWQEGAVYDLRIPKVQPVRQLIVNLAETLNLSAELKAQKRFVVRVANKAIVLSDDDKLGDFYVADGDIIEVLR